MCPILVYGGVKYLSSERRTHKSHRSSPLDVAHFTWFSLQRGRSGSGVDI
jgi:hypothetical protein